jgi:hypothetical protein
MIKIRQNHSTPKGLWNVSFEKELVSMRIKVINIATRRPKRMSFAERLTEVDAKAKKYRTIIAELGCVIFIIFQQKANRAIKNRQLAISP